MLVDSHDKTLKTKKCQLCDLEIEDDIHFICIFLALKLKISGFSIELDLLKVFCKITILYRL